MSQVIGVDFGTTNSVVSYYNIKSGRITAMRPLIAEGKTSDGFIVPTAVYYFDDNSFCIGEEALQHGVMNPRGLITSFKVDIGQKTRYNVVTDKGDEIEVSPGMAAKHFFSRLIKMYEKRLAMTDTELKAVITVPAKFTPAQRTHIKRTASEALCCPVSLAAEPTAAAASACAEQSLKDRTVLIYDFGGGTFDVSVLKAKARCNSYNFSEVITDGSRNLGGNDITFELARSLAEKISDDYGLYLPVDDEKRGKYRILEEDDYKEGRLTYNEYYKDMVRIFDYAEEMKLYFNQGSERVCYEAPILNFIIGGGKFEDIDDISYTKQEVDDLIRDKISETIRITRTVFDAAGEMGGSVDEIVLAGGSSQIALVYEELEKEFPGVEINISDDCESIISRGAVALERNNLQRVTQKTNCEYGIIGIQGVIPDKFISMIPIGEVLPCSAELSAQLQKNGQKSLEIPVYEWDKLNYPDSTRRIHNGIEQIDVVMIDNLPVDLNKDSTDLRLKLTMNTDGSFDVGVDIYSCGELIKPYNVTVGKESDFE